MPDGLGRACVCARWGWCAATSGCSGGGHPALAASTVGAANVAGLGVSWFLGCDRSWEVLNTMHGSAHSGARYAAAQQQFEVVQ